MNLHRLVAHVTLSCALVSTSILAAQAEEAQVLNPYSPALGHSYRHGVVPTIETHEQMKSWARTSGVSIKRSTGPETLSYGGGSIISGTPKVYLVVYGSQWGTAGKDGNGNMTLSGDKVGAVPYIQQLFKGLGTSGEQWSAVMTQYCDGSLVTRGATACPTGAPHVGYPTGGKAFAGIWYDNSKAAPSRATASQLAQEAIAAAAHFGNKTAASNRYAQYVILSPTGTHPDGFNTSSGNFCAWHDAANSSSGVVFYTNMPYVYDAGGSCGANFVNAGTAGKLDGFSLVLGHEYAETLTDATPGGGWVNNTNSSYAGQENGDECAWIRTGTQAASQNVTMATGKFAMQSTWSNDTNACNISHPVVTATVQNGSTVAVVNAGTGATLSVQFAATNAGARVQTSSDAGGNAWVIQSNGDGSYSLIDSATGLALDVQSAGIANGTPLQIFNSDSGLSQRWILHANGDGTFTLINPFSRKALTRHADGSAQIQDYNGSAAQRWQLMPVHE